MLRFIYTTDLHGNQVLYNRAYNLAQDYGIKTLHIGADILPKGKGMLPEQKDFVNKFLKDFYQKCSKSGIQVLSFFGNDDAYSRKKYFRKYAQPLDESPVEIEGYTFLAYGFVPDYPFGLKTACKLDRDGWRCPDEYLTDPVDIGPTGFEKIKDIDLYFKNKGTIESDLKGLSGGSKAIVAIHCPPDGVDLDVCQNGRRVGSRAIYDWILREQPLMVLCGHIHESPSCTGQWKATIGDTLVIQPGQLEFGKFSYVVVEIDNGKVSASRFEK
jgi:Icc-related predicted phosphoesterase